MTECEWLSATDPTPMLVFLQGKATDRKLRLWATACCRRYWSQILPQSSRDAILKLEQSADGLATEPELGAAFHAHERTFGKHTHDGIYYGIEAAVGLDFGYVLFGVAPDEGSKELHGSAEILRDIFGNLFRLVTADPAWLTSDVVALATGIYADHAFDRMPILADALQDAGCESDAILSHCQGDGPHVRGCWLVDLILGKS